MIVWLILLFPIAIFGQKAEFDILRARHTGQIAAYAFSAYLAPKSAKKLLKDKLKGTYRVQVNYDVTRGVEFWVHDTEPFYERSLMSYATHINMLLLPLICSRAYNRIKDKLHITIPKENRFHISYKQGDQTIAYTLSVGSLGLVDKVLYEVDDKKNFAAELTWENVDGAYVPVSVKTLGYEGVRTVHWFGIHDIVLPAH